MKRRPSALDLGQTVTLIGESVFTRCLSELKDERVEASKILRAATMKCKWQIDLGGIAKLWRERCFIRNSNAHSASGKSLKFILPSQEGAPHGVLHSSSSCSSMLYFVAQCRETIESLEYDALLETMTCCPLCTIQ